MEYRTQSNNPVRRISQHILNFKVKVTQLSLIMFKFAAELQAPGFSLASHTRSGHLGSEPLSSKFLSFSI